jgi:hypothetical protein
MPLAFQPPFDTEQGIGHLLSLAAAYDRYSVMATRSWLFTSLPPHVTEAESSTATATAEALRSLAATTPKRRERTVDVLRTYELPGSRAFDLADGTQVTSTCVDGKLEEERKRRPRRIAIAAWQQGHGHALHYPLLACSYEPIRYSFDKELEGGRITNDRERPRAAAARPEDPAAVDEHKTGALDYDGVLTRLHRVRVLDPDPMSPVTPQESGFREELDPLSGRRRLHLLVSEVMYSAVKETNYKLDRPLDADTADLLTLSLICVDPQGVAVLVERSHRLQTHPHGFASTVSGNGELAQREGITADRDARGLPDLLAATAREAEEEVGLTLGSEHDHLGVLGIHTITSESERGTHVLNLVSRLTASAAEWEPDMRANDPIEGAWELGDHLMTIDLPALKRSAAARRAFFSWLKSDVRMATHAVGGLLMMLLANATAQPKPGKDCRTPEERAEKPTARELLEEFDQAPLAKRVTVPALVTVRRWRDGDCDRSCPWHDTAQAHAKRERARSKK